MAIIITVIKCGACEPECPNTAIYEGADDWRYKDGTKLKGKIILPDGTEVDSVKLKLQFQMKYITSYQENECKVFMMNHNVLLCVQ
jgi:ferredoxin